MKSRIRALLLAFAPLFILFILLQVGLDSSATASPALTDTPPDGTAIILNPNRYQTARLTYDNEAVFGPQCVTSNGDPFSPINSTHRPPGYYTNPLRYLASDTGVGQVDVQFVPVPGNADA